MYAHGWRMRAFLILAGAGLSFAAAQAPPSPATPAPHPATAVTGIVTAGEEDAPVPGATVELHEYLDPAAERARRMEGQHIAAPAATGVTDKEGRFRVELPALPATRRFVVLASAPGHARTLLVRTLELDPGSGDTKVGRISMEPGRKLSGLVTDASGKPVSGAQVIAQPARDARGRGGRGPGALVSIFGRSIPARSSVHTGPDGRFSFESLPQQPVTLRAYADGFAPAIAESSRGSTGMTLKLTTGHRVAGKVTTPDGRAAVAGAWVMIGDDGADGITRGGQDGSFKLEHARAGAATLVATVSTTISSLPAQTKDLIAAAGPSSLLAPSAPLKITLPQAKPEPVALRLRPGGVVRARTIDSESRAAIPGSFLLLNAPGESTPRQAITGAAGNVVFTGVPVGSVSLRSEAEGYLDGSIMPGLPLATGQARDMSVAMRAASALEGTVRDAAGRPVSGAKVSVLGPPPMPLPVRIPIFFPFGVEPVTTGKDGSFVLEKLPPRDELKLTVAAEGFAPWETTGIRLRPGERRSGLEAMLDAGLLITGRVVDRVGVPIGGASLTASRNREGGVGGMVISIAGSGSRGRGMRSGVGGGGAEELPPVLTDKEGVFRVRGAKPGVWSLSARAGGFAPKTVSGLKLEEGAPLDAGSLTLEPGLTLKGRVTNLAGEPIAYAEGSLNKEFNELAVFTTLEDGTFSAGDLAPAEGVTLRVGAEGYARLEKAGFALPSEDLNLTLTAASKISGVVLDRESRRPVADFSIQVARDRSTGGGGMMMTMREAGPSQDFQSEEGVYLVEDVSPGKVQITADAPGFREATLRDIDVPPGAELKDIRIEMERAAQVSGVVLNERNQPIAGVNVSKKEKSGGGMGMRMGGGDRTYTDGDGYFVLDGLEPGQLTLHFDHDEYEATDLDVDTAGNADDLRVILPAGATLTGIVVRDEDGAPIPNATVNLAVVGGDRFSGGQLATTGPDGAFSMEGVPAGRYTLAVEATGYRSVTQNDVVVAAGQAPPPYELRLGGGVTLTGMVTHIREAEVGKVSVRAFGGAAGAFGSVAAVDASGHFEMKGLPVGSITLSAGTGLLGGRTVTRTIEIPDGKPVVETTIEFPSGSRVEGVVSRGGEPLDGARVIFVNTTTRSNATATCDGDGRYAIEDLDDGNYDINVMQFTTGASHSLKSEIRGDKTLDIELPLARVSGFITDRGTARPVDGATITFEKQGGAPSTAFRFQRDAQSDTSGLYTIEGLDDGTYVFTASKEGYGFETRTVAVNTAAPTGEISFELAPAIGLTFRAMDSSGTPLRSLSAIVLVGGGDPLSPNGSGARSVLPQSNISADASGLFTLDTLQPGSYRIVLGGSGLATETIHDVRVPASEMTFTLGDGGRLEVVDSSLTGGAVAKGVLLDSQGRPCHVNTLLTEPIFTVREGQPSLLSDVKPGSYTVRVADPSGGVAVKQVTVVQGQTARVTIP